MAVLMMGLALIFSAGDESGERKTDPSPTPELREQSADDARIQGQKGKPVQWHILEAPTESTVSIGSSVGYCPGGDRVPHISGVRQIDRPKAVILIAYFAGRPRHFSGSNGCVETLIATRVHIRGGLRDRPLYDGSQSPPKLKHWPRQLGAAER
jgi:hypothetical protein